MCYSPIRHNNKSISCAQSRASICLTVLKWSGESLYPGALPPLLKNVRTAYSPDPTNSLWVPEDFRNTANSSSQSHFFCSSLKHTQPGCRALMFCTTNAVIGWKRGCLQYTIESMGYCPWSHLHNMVSVGGLDPIRNDEIFPMIANVTF